MEKDMTGDVVELTYRPVAADFISAVRARMWLGRTGRRLRTLCVVAGFFLVLEVVLLVTGKPGVPLVLLVGSVAVPSLTLLSPWLLARQVQRLTDRQGVFRVTVTDAGVSVATDTATTTITWRAQPRYRETDRVFVLVSDDKNATGFTMLPKHGLPDRADVDRLRALLDRHLTRC
ncbi:YcxB family protein [Streptomyces sp. DSM 110735]|uniref:YcxB family protein n=1 Tax=Streptomyces sp. DSM 110735 TaxID=2775031 RepID=UPI0018F4C048|nr:YcxB family protein [Streptomyces sp. DSM 110735]MBJ7903599.1 YcxB family protein [Streptomyces sp. DSM 110735]